MGGETGAPEVREKTHLSRRRSMMGAGEKHLRVSAASPEHSKERQGNKTSLWTMGA